MPGPGPAAPHHDGSPLYLDTPDPELGGVVRVRVHVPHQPDGNPAAERVLLRSVVDGEPRLVAAAQERVDARGSWWGADLLVANPVTRYRFLLLGGDAGYRWLTAAGVHLHDVTDLLDFRVLTDQRLPDWVPDAVGYQVFPDRFARTETDEPLPGWAVPAGWDDPVVPNGPETPYQIYGGTLTGVAEHLDHLRSLGVTLLYLTPVFPARSNHRYDAASFDVVDPLLGGDAAYDDLLAACRTAGLRLVGDLTTNHTGETHDWFVRARQNGGGPERSFYTFTDDGLGYLAWLDVPSLPKLDHGSPELRRRLYEGADSVVARGLARGQAGWRIDVANMTGRHGREDRTHEVASTIRATMRAVDPEAWLLAEHGHDASLDLVGSGWHGTMDYAGFTRPIWTWLGAGPFDGNDNDTGTGTGDLPEHLGLVVEIPRLDGEAVATTMREVHAAMPWASWAASTTHLDSHDTGRFRTVVGGGPGLGAPAERIDRAGTGRARHLVGLAAQMTMPGVPVVFMGDEIGLTGINGEHARTPFPWQLESEWDHETLAAYKAWIHLRLDRIALRRGSFRWVHQGPESLTFVREHPDESVLVHLVRDSTPGAGAGAGAGAGLPGSMLPFELGMLGPILGPLLGQPARVEDDRLVLPATGPSAHAYVIG